LDFTRYKRGRLVVSIFLLDFSLFIHSPTRFQTAKKKTVSNASNGFDFPFEEPFEAPFEEIRLKSRLKRV
jgi:hypothetical protein